VGEAAAFAARLGLPFRNLELLEQALTHPSWYHEHANQARGHNERLELLGDAVINLAITSTLLERFPVEDEGALSARRAWIVSTAGLGRLAERIHLADSLRLGHGEARGDGRIRPLPSAFEAIAGAIFLDLGWDAARNWIIDVARPEIEADLGSAALKSAKSRLQELTQRSGRGRPVYEIVEASGLPHARTFTVHATVDGVVLGHGRGSSRRAAETEAAAAAVLVLEAEGAA
jgi:ribonuclease-3